MGNIGSAPSRRGYSKRAFRAPSENGAIAMNESGSRSKCNLSKHQRKGVFVRWHGWKRAADVITKPNRGKRVDQCSSEGAAVAPVAVTFTPESTSDFCKGKDSILDGTPRTNRSRPKRPINVNTCNVFDLSSLDGVDQTIATNIVIYREKKGRFTQLDRLLKVPGVTKSIYCLMAPFVTVVSLEDDDSSGLHVPNGGRNGNATQRVCDHKGHSRQSSAFSSYKSSAIDGLDLLLRIPVDTEGGKDLEQANIDLIYRLMCSKSERPTSKGLGKDIGCNEITGETSYDFTRLRFGCWDLEGCSFDKANNPGVLEVICMTILENRWNFVALTDLASGHVVDRLVAELNFPTLNKGKMWRQNCQLIPRFDCVTFYCHEMDCFNGYLFTIPFAHVERVAAPEVTFKIGPNDIAFRYGVKDESQCQETDSLDEVRIERYSVATPPGNGYLCFGQYGVRWSGQLSSRFAGRAGIVEDGLTHLAIPNGWTLGGRVTRSNPIWAEFLLSDKLNDDQFVFDVNEELINGFHKA